jgi:hypothetical protein
MKLSWQGSAYLGSFWLLCAAAVAFAQMEHAHPPAIDMDCTKLSPGLQAVVAAMGARGVTVQAAEKRENAPALEPGMKKLVLVLHPMSAVQPVAGKIKAGENPDSVFGGFIRFMTPADGLYRISADSTVWLDVLDGDQPKERARDTSRLHCGKIEKSLGFPLAKGHSYWIELSASKRREVSLLITPE